MEADIFLSRCYKLLKTHPDQLIYIEPFCSCCVISFCSPNPLQRVTAAGTDPPKDSKQCSRKAFMVTLISELFCAVNVQTGMNESGKSDSWRGVQNPLRPPRIFWVVSKSPTVSDFVFEKVQLKLAPEGGLSTRHPLSGKLSGCRHLERLHRCRYCAGDSDTWPSVRILVPVVEWHNSWHHSAFFYWFKWSMGILKVPCFLQVLPIPTPITANHRPVFVTIRWKWARNSLNADDSKRNSLDTSLISLLLYGLKISNASSATCSASGSFPMAAQCTRSLKGSAARTSLEAMTVTATVNSSYARNWVFLSADSDRTQEPGHCS